MARKKLKYQRILLKISGEALQGPEGSGLHPGTLSFLAKENLRLAEENKRLQADLEKVHSRYDILDL